MDGKEAEREEGGVGLGGGVVYLSLSSPCSTFSPSKVFRSHQGPAGLRKDPWAPQEINFGVAGGGAPPPPCFPLSQLEEGLEA